MRYLPTPVIFGSVLGLAGAVLLASANSAAAAQPPVGLGVATSFVVLAGSTVTNTGPSVLNGDLGLSPGTAIPGVNTLPGPATVNGHEHVTDGVAAQAQLDLTTAYNSAAGRTPETPVGADLTGQTLGPGVYKGGALGLSGKVTLNGHNNPAAVFIFKAASTLITSSNSTVALVGVNPCNVFWQVGSSATLGTHSNFVGTIMALSDISATTGATVQGRLLARNGAVTLDDNVISRPQCSVTNPSTSPSPTPTKTKPGGGASSTPGGGGSSTPGGGTSHPNGGPSTSTSHTPGVPLHSPRTSTGPHGSTSPPQGTPPSSSTPGQPPHLARTGNDNAGLAIGGALAIVVGGLLLLITRRTPFRGPRNH
jgi:hypothetical protein